MPKTYKVTAKINIFQMDSPWRYILIPQSCVPNVRPGGWGSIPVVVTIGKTTWKTSLFPMKGNQYFLPIKKLVIKQENLKVGDSVQTVYTELLRSAKIGLHYNEFGRRDSFQLVKKE